MWTDLRIFLQIYGSNAGKAGHPHRAFLRRTSDHQAGSQREHPFEITNIILIDSAGVLPVRTTAQKWKIRKYKILKKFLNMKLIYAMFPEVIDDWRSRQGSADYRNATPMMRQCMVKAVNEDLTELLPKIRQEVLPMMGRSGIRQLLSGMHILWKRRYPTAAWR